MDFPMSLNGVLRHELGHVLGLRHEDIRRDRIKLDDFIRFMKSEMPDTYLTHLLTTYPEGVQK